MAFKYSGGCRWDSLCAADVTMDPATGDPLSCKNPITGAEISGGGDTVYKINMNGTYGSFAYYSTPVVDPDTPNYYIQASNENEIDIVVYVAPPADNEQLLFYPEEGFTIEGDYEEVVISETTFWKILGDCTISAE